MKRRDILLAMTVFALVSTRGLCARAAAPLFADKNLETAVREELKKAEKEELKEDDLKNVYFLRAKGKKIANLAGLDLALNYPLPKRMPVAPPPPGTPPRPQLHTGGGCGAAIIMLP